MANANRPSGLAPVGYLNGAPWTGGGRVYCIPDSDDTNAFAIGDPVMLAGSADDNGIPTITLATAGTGNLVLGAIVSGAGALSYGSAYGVPQDSPIVIPAVKSRNYYVLVADDPNTIFEIQEDSVGGAIAVTNIALNHNLASGTNNGYVSGWMLDSSGAATTATLQMKILQLAPRQDNAVGTYAKWWTIINNHAYRIGQAGKA